VDSGRDGKSMSLQETKKTVLVRESLLGLGELEKEQSRHIKYQQSMLLPLFSIIHTISTLSAQL
jgi:hypothetical protein